MSEFLVCDIYKSPRKEQMYLYIQQSHDFAEVPEPLLNFFGEPEFVMSLTLKPDTRLARVDRDELERLVLQQGYYLQMPPGNGDGQVP